MPTYVVLSRFTEKGITNIKQGPSRIDALKKEFRAKGAKLKDFYLLMGRYDTLLIFDSPDEKTAAKLMLALGAAGNVRTETMSAFSEAEYKKLVAGLS